MGVYLGGYLCEYVAKKRGFGLVFHIFIYFCDESVLRKAFISYTVCN